MTEEAKRPRFPFPQAKPVGLAMAAVWEATPILNRLAWAEVFSELFPLRQATHPERAGRLSAYGWKPEDLQLMCTNPWRVETLHRRFDDPWSEESMEARAALMHEVTLFHKQAHEMSRLHRDVGTICLMSEHGWTREQAGELLRMLPVKDGLRNSIMEFLTGEHEPVWKYMDDDEDYDHEEIRSFRDAISWVDVALREK